MLCTVCHQPIDGPAVTDEDAGHAFHQPCLVGQAVLDLAQVSRAVAVAVLAAWGA